MSHANVTREAVKRLSYAKPQGGTQEAERPHIFMPVSERRRPAERPSAQHLAYLSAAIDFYPDLEMTFRLPQAEAALEQLAD